MRSPTCRGRYPVPVRKFHGICGQRGFQEVRLNAWADTQYRTQPSPNREQPFSHGALRASSLRTTGHTPKGSRVLTCLAAQTCQR